MRALQHALCAVVVAVILLAGNAATAQSDSAVIVLFHGGVDSVDVHDLAAGQAVRLGEERFSSEQTGAWTGTDIKRLSSGGHLIAQAAGAGFAILDADGELTYELDPARRYQDVPSASVAGYVAIGEPSRVVMADSFSSALVLRDIKADQLVWFQNMQNSGRFASFRQVITMPESRIASATTWTELGVHAIDVFTFKAIEVERQQFANVVGAEAPADTVAVAALQDGISDIFGLSESRLLVATPATIFEMDLQGNVIWEFDSRDDLEVAGEIGNVRRLPSGLVAFTTFARGFWIESHPNHRVHWIDPTTQLRVASSAPLSRAPASLDTYTGHGATGTDGFLAGLDEIGMADPDAVNVGGFGLDGLEFERGDLMRPRIVWLNEGDYVFASRRLEIVAFEGSCDARQGDAIELAVATDIALVPATSFVLTDSITVGERFGLGAWCAVARLVDRDGAVYERAELGFEIVEEKAGDSPVDITDLDFDSPSDAGFDAGDVGPAPPPSEDGGCCSTTPANPAADVLLVVLAMGLVRRLSAPGRARR